MIIRLIEVIDAKGFLELSKRVDESGLMLDEPREKRQRLNNKEPQ